MTSPSMHTYLPRMRGSRRARFQASHQVPDILRTGIAALRGSAVVAAVLGAAGSIMLAVIFLFVTTVAMLGLFSGVFAAVPAISLFSAK